MAVFGTTLPVFLVLTVLMFGGAAWMMGRALGLTLPDPAALASVLAGGPGDG